MEPLSLDDLAIMAQEVSSSWPERPLHTLCGRQGRKAPLRHTYHRLPLSPL